jgi:hypothetical protein
MHAKVQLENLKGRGHLEDLRHRWGNNLEWILGKQGRKVWTEFIWPRMWTSGKFSYEHEPSGSMKGGEFLD